MFPITIQGSMTSERLQDRFTTLIPLIFLPSLTMTSEEEECTSQPQIMSIQPEGRIVGSLGMQSLS
jgi:hypothetical protein